MTRHSSDVSPSPDQRIALADRLERLFGFSHSQALYLVVQSFGYCDDVVQKYDKIQNDMDQLKKILKGMEIL